MFSGLVLERGRLTAPPEPTAGGGQRLRVRHSPTLGERLGIGASVSVSGVCLTVTETHPGESTFELSPETLARTTLGRLGAGAEVNLEPALRLGDSLGGHWVQGHVDATCGVRALHELGAHREATFELPAELRPYVVEKGSVTLDGVSLTVAAIAGDSFTVALIPHTLEVTTLGALEVGSTVNFEIDVLAKYVERALVARGLGAGS